MNKNSELINKLLHLVGINTSKISNYFYEVELLILLKINILEYGRYRNNSRSTDGLKHYNFMMYLKKKIETYNIVFRPY